ncbi:MAG: hypothetical protein KDJ14_15625 [Xanthomonadales bacterium]|nr:hypothetical protein [Xanthomonadales bacterium]
MNMTFHRLAALAAASIFVLAACSETPPPEPAAPAAPAKQAMPSETAAPAAPEAPAEPRAAKSPEDAYAVATSRAQGEYDLAVKQCDGLRSQRGKDKCKEAAANALERSVAEAESAFAGDESEGSVDEDGGEASGD